MVLSSIHPTLEAIQNEIWGLSMHEYVFFVSPLFKLMIFDLI